MDHQESESDDDTKDTTTKTQSAQTSLKSKTKKKQQTVESMREIMKVTEEEKKYRAENFDAENLSSYINNYKCTICGYKYNKVIKNGSNLSVHPLLDVLMCKTCCEYYGDGNFSLDSEGEDKYCRWCGQGGTIYSCSKCICAFCDTCIKNHFQLEGLKKVEEDDDWVCYFCDPKPLWKLRSMCSFANELSKQNKEKRLANQSVNLVQEDSSNLNSDEKKTGLQRNNTDKGSGRRMRTSRARAINFLEYVSSSSENEKENKIKVKRKKRRKLRKGSISNSSSELDESSKAPSKRKKVVTDSSSSESKTRDESKNLVVDKLKGIWKITQIVTQMGLNSSKERLKNLSKPVSLDDLRHEYDMLKSVMLVLSSSLNKACDSVTALKDDLSCENVKDESHIFQTEEERIKTLIRELQVDGEIGMEDDVTHAGGSSQDETKKGKSKDDEKPQEGKKVAEDAGSDEKEEVKKVKSPRTRGKKKKKLLDSSEESENEEKRKTDNADQSVSLITDRENESEVVNESIEKVDNVKRPLLKVKSFARMTTANVFNTNGVQTDGKESNEKGSDEQTEDQVNVYTIETDSSSDEKNKKEENKEEEKAKSQPKSPEECETPRRLTRKSANSSSVKFDTFENFRQKRKQYLKNQKSETKKETKNASSAKVEEEKKESADGEGKAKDGKENDSDVDYEAKGSKEKSDKENDSEDSSSSDSQPRGKRGRKRVRKRKKNKLSSGSEEGETEKQKKKGRRNIKKILKKDSLKLETKEALAKESERKKRIEEKRKLMAELFPENSDGKKNTKKLILDFDEETKEPLVEVNQTIVAKLKPHQIEGIKFMWDNCFESSKRLEEDSGSGCILAHCMGLGKTLQVIAFVHTIFNQNLGVNTVLIMCPLNVVPNWLNEFEEWLSDVDTEPILLYDLLKEKKNDSRRDRLEEWHKTGGVMVLSYDMFRNLTRPPSGKLRKHRNLQSLVQSLLDPGPDVVICDEGHLIKNESTALSKQVNSIKTSRRIILTGTPLQNNLMEYHCMVSFIKPNMLGTTKEFLNRFVNPINNGQFEDSTEHDVKVMKRRSHVLHSLLSGCVQRFDYSVLTPFLPKKYEYVLSISLTESQANAYQHFLQNLSSKGMLGAKAAYLFNDYNNLQRIWTHPRILLMYSQKEDERRLSHDSEGSLKDFVVSSDEEEEEEEEDEDEDESVSESSDSSGSSKKGKKKVVARRVLRSNANNPEVMKMVEEEEKEVSVAQNWWNKFFKKPDFEDVRAGNKLMLLFSLLRYCGEINEKILIFSQSLFTLDLIEYFLNRVDENNGDELLAGFKDSWVHGVDYFRIDGTTGSDKRSMACDLFNDKSNTRARLFLISTRAGGLGINLVAANRVVIFDVSWNPSHDLQSIFRVYRFGQTKPCYVYRFLAEGTMEEKIYERQVTKLSLAHRVVDEYQIERHYSMMNLQELYKFEPTPPENRKTPIVPKDEVLADLLIDHKDLVVGYHEHDSLLENREEEELTEEERKAAWQEFEEEKQNRAVQFPQGMPFQYPQMLQLNPSYVQGPVQFIATGQPQMVNSIQVRAVIPYNLLHRGLQIGLHPFVNESPEAYLSRIINREAILGNDRREA